MIIEATIDELAHGLACFKARFTLSNWPRECRLLPFILPLPLQSFYRPVWPLFFQQV